MPSLTPRAPRVDSTEPIVLEANELGKVYRERSFFGTVREVAAAQDVTLILRKGPRSASSAKAAPANPPWRAASSG